MRPIRSRGCGIHDRGGLGRWQAGTSLEYVNRSKTGIESHLSGALTNVALELALGEHTGRYTVSENYKGSQEKVDIVL